MSILTKVIFENQHYQAAILPNKLLCVCFKRKKGGKILNEKDTLIWKEAIETAIDKKEANALCRAIVNN